MLCTIYKEYIWIVCYEREREKKISVTNFRIFSFEYLFGQHIEETGTGLLRILNLNSKWIGHTFTYNINICLKYVIIIARDWFISLILILYYALGIKVV